MKAKLGSIILTLHTHFLNELEQLLNKAYSLLPPQEKKLFSYVQREGVQSSASLLQVVWERLSQVKYLTFHAKTKSKEKGGWNGRGTGEVSVTKEQTKVLLFHEKGSWQDISGNETDFSNVFRWTYDRDAKVISLEHLRHGIDNPVFLFHLAPAGVQSLASIDSHLCDGDAYFGKIICDQHSLRLKWRVIGPRKNEEIETYYS